MVEYVFDHEKLKVYQKSIEFVEWSERIIKRIKFKGTIVDQFDRAVCSISLNIAEGNGKYSNKDRCRYFDIAKGSSLESAACLDIMFYKGMIVSEELHEGKVILKEIVSMIVGLIKANSNRKYEVQ